ncbi:hypothetical protein COEREDRAFT_36649 [Coemansia reversa NRRL 1564]|uniref:Sodium/nucleoside cotransporter n=1 Tax=Coemansia reversa (strain ATCC 12441 / NRRL 1564) TaxID=763665 RepID=A0A2G5BKH3_COERN|nr:hypothetical protein COEREDRAFT_36649 [Coemansia reversa NRRL 1564]|eukprot:PIA19516.1 hypothetical protein COEREDRAFT_36649 [Coemansia reversa NRRL 1564]
MPLHSGGTESISGNTSDSIGGTTGIEENDACDVEKSDDQLACKDPRPRTWAARARRVFAKYKSSLVAVIWLVVTAYFIAALSLKKKRQTSDVLTLVLLYVFVTGRIVVYFIPTQPLRQHINKTWMWGSSAIIQRIPEYLRYPLSTLLLLVVALSVSLGLDVVDNDSRLARMQSFFGIVLITGLLVLTSRHKASINWQTWHTVIIGYLVQFCLGCIVIKTSWGNDLFSWMANSVSSLLEFSRYGAKFLFGEEIGSLENFAMTVFPAFIFFAAFVQMMNYLGAVQWLLQNLGRVVQKIMDTSGAESLVVAAAPFLGQIENALLVKDYLEHMTSSELHACMTAGFATVSGSTLQGYVALGVNAKNIITACIMSIPCSLALSKIRYPETEESMTRGRVVAPPRDTGEANILHAIGNGAMTGIDLALLVAANLIAVIALVDLADFLLTWLGEFVSIHGLTMELVVGYVLYPYAWLLGVPTENILDVSQLLGLKFIANEFVAYNKLNDVSSGPSLKSQMTARAQIIAEFALCGFGNFSSIAQQIGTLGALAPSRKGEVSRIALSACITGSIATTVTAAIVSMVI